MGLLEENNECLILQGKMMKYIHLAYSEAFDVQLQDCCSSELVDGVLFKKPSGFCRKNIVKSKADKYNFAESTRTGAVMIP